MRKNFLKIGINFDKKYSNLQTALHTRKTKVIESLLDGTKKAYKKKKPGLKNKKFKTELSDYSADDPVEATLDVGRPHSDYQKSDYEYESSQASSLNLGGESNFSSYSMHSDISDCEDTSLMNRRQILEIRRQKSIDIDGRIASKIKEKMIRKKGGKNKKGGGLVKQASGKQGGIEFGVGLAEGGSPRVGAGKKGAEREREKEAVGREIEGLKAKMKGILGGKNEKLELGFGGVKKKDKKKGKKQEGRLESIKAKKSSSQRFTTQKSSSSSSVDTEYLDLAAHLDENLDTKLNIDAGQVLKRSHQRASSIELDKTPKSHLTGKSAPKDPYLSGIKEEIAADIQNKKELLHKHPTKSKLADTLRDHLISKEKKKGFLEELAMKHIQQAHKQGIPEPPIDNRPRKPEPAYEEINQYTNTSSKLDTWRTGKLTDFITLKHQVQVEKEDPAKKDAEKSELERDLLDPSKNFLDILDMMLSPENIREPSKKLEEANKPDIQVLKDLIMDRKKKQIQLSRHLLLRFDRKAEKKRGSR